MLANPKHLLGARVGFTAVLHSWGSALTHHPHVHMIVPGGGLSSDEVRRWIACKPRFFLLVRALSRLFRRLFLEGLAALHQAGQVGLLRRSRTSLLTGALLNAALAPVATDRMGRLRQAAIRRTRSRCAVALSLSLHPSRRDLKQPISSPLTTTACHPSRLEGLSVRLRRRGAQQRVDQGMTLPVDEFIRRFLMHVLPNGFHRIRHYGLFASQRRAANIAHLRELLANPDDASQGPVLAAPPAWASQTPPAPISRTRSQSPRYAPVAAET